MFDRDLRFVLVSAATADVLGKRPDDIRGARLPDVCPLLAATIEPCLRRVLATGEPVLGRTAETEMPDGTVRSAVEHFYAVFDGGGDVVGVGNVWWETTKQRAADAARDRFEERFGALTDASPVLVWMAGPDGRCDRFNEPWLAFRGRTIEQERDFGWIDGVHPDDHERSVQGYESAFAAREPFETEYRLRRHDGTWRWVLDRRVPRFDREGSFLGYIGSCVDIDDLKAAEREHSVALVAERFARGETERVAARLARLQSVTAAFARALTMEEVYDTVVEQAVSATGAEAGVVCLFHRGSGTIELVRAVGYPPEHIEPFRRFGVTDDVPIAEAVRTSRQVLIGPIGEAGGGYERHRKLAAVSGRNASASLPLMVDDECIGALGLSFGEVQDFDAAQRAFLGAVAAQAAAALQRTRLWEAERQARAELELAHERLTFLAEATRVTAFSLDRTEILQQACRLAVPRIADFAVAYVQEGRELRRLALAHADPATAQVLSGLVNRLPYRVNDDVPVSRCWRTRRVLRFSSLGEEHLTDAPGPVREAIGGMGLGPSLYVPIVARKQTLGVLALAYEARRHGGYTAEDVTVATELASRIASALENARLYAREHAVAVQLQRAVLPQQLPREDGIEISVRYLPSSSGVLVGGDWYDAFRLRDGRLGLAVGDVAGHGVLAAATMGQLRNALRAYASEGAPPSTVLRRLSQLVADDGDAVFATATYGVYDLAARQLLWANAGHVPALLCSDRGTRFLNEPVDPILGVDQELEYGLGQATLEPGDMMLWYTDGLVERRGEDLDTGLKRLEAAVVAARTRPLEEICDSVVQAMVDAESQADDICLLAIRPA